MKVFTVVGRAPFPFDMLRYDEAFPADMDAAAEMHDASEPSRGGWHYITLATRKPTGATGARWRSFGWKAYEGRVRADAWHTVEEIA